MAVGNFSLFKKITESENESSRRRFTIHRRWLEESEEYPNKETRTTKRNSKCTYPNHYEFTNHTPLPPKKDLQDQ